MKFTVRILTLALCLAMLLALSPTTFAARTESAEEETLVEKATATISGSNVSFRKGPGSNYGRISRLARGTVVTVVDNTTNPSWCKVILEDGTEGYVSAQYVQFDALSALPEEEEEDKKSASSGSSYTPSAKDPNASKIASAKKKNSDVIGWIEVPNTNIDDPILYAPNFYYGSHDINKKKSNDGVYPYYNRLTKNIALFGHNLRGSGTGFHALHHMQEAAAGYSRCQSSSCGKSLGSTHKNWVKDNRVWNISIFGKTKWEVFSMYEVTHSEPISTLRNNWSALSGKSQSSVQKWIDNQLERSEFDFGVSVSPSDTFLTIITCATNYRSNTNARLFVVMKCVG